MKASIDVLDKVAKSKTFEQELSTVDALAKEVPSEDLLWNSRTASLSIPSYESWVDLHASLINIEVNSTTRFRNIHAGVLGGLRKKQEELVARLLEVAKTKLGEQFSACVDQWLCEAAMDEEVPGDDMGEYFAKLSAKKMLQRIDLNKISGATIVAPLRDFIGDAIDIIDVLTASASSCIALARGRAAKLTEEPMMPLAAMLGKVAGGLPDTFGVSGKKLHEHLMDLLTKVVRKDLAESVESYKDFAMVIDKTPIDEDEMYSHQVTGGLATEVDADVAKNCLVLLKHYIPLLPADASIAESGGLFTFQARCSVAAVAPRCSPSLGTFPRCVASRRSRRTSGTTRSASST